MNHILRYLVLTVALSGLSTEAFAENPAKAMTTIYMAGDSTMSTKHVKDYPETGWGVPFSSFFDNGIQVVNHAKNGRSTRTFIEEGRWKTIITKLKPNDYVFIQFGHNDQSEHKKDRYTPPAQYRVNLKRFIADVRSKKARPILLSPIVRRYFNEKGKLVPSHPYAASISREIGESEKAVFLDMEKITHDYFETMGNRDSALRFMHIAPGLHPNYPMGVSDDTHLNQLGAREVAQLVLAELKKQGHPLSKRLRIPDPKHLKLKYKGERK